MAFENMDQAGAIPQTVTGTLVSAVDRSLMAQVDRQVATAKAYPRQLSVVLRQASDMVSVNKETAAGCYYGLRRKDGNGNDVIIEGPSVRVAEIIMSCWGNISARSEIIEEGEKFVVARGQAWDMEKNVATSVDVRRSIWGKYGRYSQDMIGVTSQAAVSIALRNALLRVVPRVYIDQLVTQAKAVAAGDAKAIQESWQEVCKTFLAMHATQEQVLAYLGIQGPQDVTTAHIAELRGLYTALRDGEIAFDEAFPPARPAEPKAPPSTSAADAMKAKLQAAQAPTQPEADPPKRPGRPAGSRNRPKAEPHPEEGGPFAPATVVPDRLSDHAQEVLTPYRRVQAVAISIGATMSEVDTAAGEAMAPQDPELWTEQDAALVTGRLKIAKGVR